MPKLMVETLTCGVGFSINPTRAVVAQWVGKVVALWRRVHQSLRNNKHSVKEKRVMENPHGNDGFFEILFNDVILEIIHRVAALISGLIYGIIDPILPPAA